MTEQDSDQAGFASEEVGHGKTRQLVTLHTGEEVPRVAVSGLMVILQQLHQEKYLAFYELAQLARDPGHAMWAPARPELHGLALIDTQDRMHDVTRAVVKAVAVGEGTEITLRSPFLVEGR